MVWKHLECLIRLLKEEVGAKSLVHVRYIQKPQGQMNPVATGPVWLGQKDTICADLLQPLVDETQKEMRPQDLLASSTKCSWHTQGSSFAAQLSCCTWSEWVSLLGAAANHGCGSASVLIISGGAICGMYVKMMSSGMANALFWGGGKEEEGRKNSCWMLRSVGLCHSWQCH